MSYTLIASDCVSWSGHFDGDNYDESWKQHLSNSAPTHRSESAFDRQTIVLHHDMATPAMHYHIPFNDVGALATLGVEL